MRRNATALRHKLSADAELFGLTNARGQVIRGLVQEPRGDAVRTVVWCPVPDTAWHTMDLPAAYCLENAMRFVRFGATNALGPSDGDRRDATLTSLEQDVDLVVRHMVDMLGLPISVVTPSLASRVALRAAASRGWDDVDLVLYFPVLDVDATFRFVFGREYAAMFEWAADKLDAGGRVMETLSINVALIKDALDGEWATVDRTRRELCAARCRSISAVLGSDDAWVETDKAVAVLDGRAGVRVSILPGVGHGMPLFGSGEAAKTLLRHVAGREDMAVEAPPPLAVLEQHRVVEQARAAIKAGAVR